MICHLCGCKLAESDDGLKNHMKRYHAVHQQQVKSKYRPKAEVVADWESRHMQHLIIPTVVEPVVAPVKKIVKEHVESCNCNVCFNVKLDKLLASSEEALNAARASLGVNDDVASDQL